MPPLTAAMQNYAPLRRQLYLRRRDGDDGSLADCGIKHEPGGLSKCLIAGLFFRIYEDFGGGRGAGARLPLYT